MLDKNIKSYFQNIKSWKRDNKKFTGCPRFPKYKDKINGRNIVVFTYAQVNIKEKQIKFPKQIKLELIKTNVTNDNLCQIRIVPQNSCYVVEIVYEKQEKQYIDNNNYLAIDLGVNNLVTCVDNITNKSLIISGKSLKSINQYYNKKKAAIQSQLEKNHKKKTSKKLQKLTLKRNNKINDYLHRCSKHVVQYCLKNNITNIIIGKNDGWKQEINLGKKNNQNFIQIPFDKLIQQIIYKGLLNGIKVQTINEAYTSKCSALDLEDIQKHDIYLGNRIKRGLFISSNKTKINADLNGALNILRKEIGDKALIEQTLTNRGQVMWPLKINFYKFF